MRSLAVALLALALPTAAQAALTREGPPPRSGAPGIGKVETVVSPAGVGRELHEAREAIDRRRDIQLRLLLRYRAQTPTPAPAS